MNRESRRFVESEAKETGGSRRARRSRITFQSRENASLLRFATHRNEAGVEARRKDSKSGAGEAVLRVAWVGDKCARERQYWFSIGP